MTRDESWSELQSTMPLEQVFSGTQMVLVRHVHDAAFANGGRVEMAPDIKETINRHSDALAKAMAGRWA